MHETSTPGVNFCLVGIHKTRHDCDKSNPALLMTAPVICYMIALTLVQHKSTQAQNIDLLRA